MIQRGVWLFLVCWGISVAFCGLLIWDQMVIIVGLMSLMIGLIVMAFS